DQDRPFRMPEDIDESGDDDLIACVDRFLRRRARKIANLDDCVAADSDVRAKPCASGAVDDVTVDDADVELRFLSVGLSGAGEREEKREESHIRSFSPLRGRRTLVNP